MEKTYPINDILNAMNQINSKNTNFTNNKKPVVKNKKDKKRNNKQTTNKAKLFGNYRKNKICMSIWQIIFYSSHSRAFTK